MKGTQQQWTLEKDVRTLKIQRESKSGKKENMCMGFGHFESKSDNKSAPFRDLDRFFIRTLYGICRIAKNWQHPPSNYMYAWDCWRYVTMEKCKKGSIVTGTLSTFKHTVYSSKGKWRQVGKSTIVRAVFVAPSQPQCSNECKHAVS